MLGSRTVEQLRAELTLAERTQEEICSRQADWSESPPSSQELHAAAERLDQAFRVQIDDAEAKVEAARSAHAAAVQKLMLQEQEIHATQGRITAARQRLEQLTADGRDDARRQDDVGHIY
jgi:hypothetical protein